MTEAARAMRQTRRPRRRPALAQPVAALAEAAGEHGNSESEVKQRQERTIKFCGA